MTNFADIDSLVRGVIAPHTVCFVEVGPKPSVAVAGSGVLLRISDRLFIASAKHVTREIMKKPEIGVCHFPNFSQQQGQKYSPKNAFVHHANPSILDDVALLEISPEYYQNFQNLSIAYMFQPSDPGVDLTPIGKNVFCCGGVFELTNKKIPKTSPSKHVQSIEGMSVAMRFRRASNRDGIQFFWFSPEYDEHSPQPSSFAGLSGSPIWILKFGSESGSMMVLRKELAGIAVCEGRKLDLICGQSVKNISSLLGSTQ